MSKFVQLTNDEIILRVNCYTAIAKPENGSFQNKVYMLNLGKVPYTYEGIKNNKKVIKEEYVDTYLIKGIRGALRHAVMKICKQYGYEVCHSTDKTEIKDPNQSRDRDNTEKNNTENIDPKTKKKKVKMLSILPEGFHPIGTCLKSKTGECLVHTIFGSIRKESKFRVHCNPVADVNKKTATFQTKVQLMTAKMENRTVFSYDNIPAQNFEERYISGFFSFELNVSKCEPKELGMLLEAAIHISRLGRGYNAGYGSIQILSYEIFKCEIIFGSTWNAELQKHMLTEESKEVALPEKAQEALEAWHEYVKKQVTNSASISILNTA